MKRFLIILSCLFLMVGCSWNNTPSKKTEELLKKYQTLDEGVISDLELTTEGSSLSNEKDKENYMKAMKMQYSDMKFKIVNEVVEGDEATVTVNISVYDFYKVQKDADKYREDNEDEFLTDGIYDEIKFMGYKLKNMLDADERVDYTIEVKLEKEDDKWVPLAFDKTTLEKIHGTYDYESD